MNPLDYLAAVRSGAACLGAERHDAPDATRLDLIDVAVLLGMPREDLEGLTIASLRGVLRLRAAAAGVALMHLRRPRPAAERCEWCGKAVSACCPSFKSEEQP